MTGDSDRWQVTCDMWHVTHGEGWKFSKKNQLPSCNSLGLKMIWRYGGKGWHNQWKNVWINDKATQGLLKIPKFSEKDTKLVFLLINHTFDF